jgi:hypothetical protein
LTFTVEVQEDGTAAQGETVTFSITSGDENASLGTPNPATTGNDGQAEIELTLGDSASEFIHDYCDKQWQICNWDRDSYLTTDIHHRSGKRSRLRRARHDFDVYC